MADEKSIPNGLPPKSGAQHDASEEETPTFAKLPLDEEVALLRESAQIKAEANALFTSADYHNAVARYHDALEPCPSYRYFERSVLHSNIAACYLKLEQWKEAVGAASDAIKDLEKLEDDPRNPESSRPISTSQQVSKKGRPRSQTDEDDEVEVEIVSTGASKSAPAPLPAPSPSPSSPTAADILRIRTKALLRRGRARSAMNTWSDLSSAEEDYRAVSALPPDSLGAADMHTVRQQLRDLPNRTKAAQEREMGEMWGKLRQLGDGILKPFGLSTNNFQMVKDEKTGGYSVNFTQGQGGQTPSTEG